MFGRKKLLKKIDCLEDTIHDLKEELKSARASNEAYRNEIADAQRNIKISEEKERKSREELEKKERELDILYQYYDILKEPTQEVKTAVRIDKRVHDLELENMELRNRVRQLSWTLEQEFNFKKSYVQSIMYGMNAYGQNTMYGW